MKRLIFIIGFLCCIIPFTASWGASWRTTKENKVLSPYFFVQSKNPSIDPFRLLETKAMVDNTRVIVWIDLT